MEHMDIVGAIQRVVTDAYMQLTGSEIDRLKVIEHAIDQVAGDVAYRLDDLIFGSDPAFEYSDEDTDVFQEDNDYDEDESDEWYAE